MSARPAAVALALVALLAAGCGPTTIGSLPPDAPLHAGDCGWRGDVVLAFAGWSTPVRLGIGQEDVRVFAVVSRDRIEQHPFVGPAIEARGLCARYPNRSVLVTGVPDDWRPPFLWP